jgi:uncharacterized membrane protein
VANRTTKGPPGPAGGTDRPVPAWRRVTEGEHRWTAALAVVAMIVLQSRVPEHLVLVSWWLLPALEAILLLALIAANPGRLGSSSHALHRLSLALIAVASLATGWAAASLVAGLVRGTEGQDAKSLLFTGGNIWVTNIVVFALWYWDLDRGGPGARARNEQDEPDFLFSQMTAPELAPRDWEPRFHDYLYLAYTNATAFSPTDTMPFSRWSKMTMMLQSTISLVTGALIVARAVNILR